MSDRTTARSLRTATIALALAPALALGAAASAQSVTQIIDASGDGAGAELEWTWAIFADDDGTAHVTGLTSNNLFKITPDGTVTEILQLTGLYTGHELAMDSAGNLYVSEHSKVKKITPGGEVTTVVDHSGDGNGNILSYIWGIALDAADNLYVTGRASQNAFKVTPDGTVTEIIDGEGDGAGNPLRNPQAVAVDSVGNVYVADAYAGSGHYGSPTSSVFKITPQGVITELIDESGDGAGHQMLIPFDVVVDSSDNVYVAASYTDNVFKITPSGAITEFLNSSGDGAGNVLANPVGLAVDGFDNLYVTSSTSTTDTVLRATPSGDVTVIIDGSGDGNGNILEWARTIATDRHGNVWIAGQNSHNAFKVAPPAAGTSFCSSLANATGSPAVLSAVGEPNATLLLTSSPVPNTIGHFFYGPMMLAGSTMLGDGLRCAGGSLTRMLPAVNAGMMMQPPNAAVLAVSYDAPYAAGLTGTRYFQYWFRSGLPTGSGSNTSDAVEITF